MEEILSSGGEVRAMSLEMSPVEFDAALLLLLLLLPSVVDVDPNSPDMIGGKVGRDDNA